MQSQDNTDQRDEEERKKSLETSYERVVLEMTKSQEMDASSLSVTMDGQQQPKIERETNAREVVSKSDFVMIKQLGVGSYGRVLLVQHKRSKKYFAMKILKKKRIRELN